MVVRSVGGCVCGSVHHQRHLIHALGDIGVVEGSCTAFLWHRDVVKRIVCRDYRPGCGDVARRALLASVAGYTAGLDGPRFYLR